MKKPKIIYIICATPRSGSSLLCDALSNTEIAGKPKEHLTDWKTLRLMKWKDGQSLSDYFNSAANKGATSNGVSGIKIMFKEFTDLIKIAGKKPEYKNLSLDNAADYLPNIKYIFMTRRSKIRQAISLDKAIQTKKWFLKENEEHVNVKKPVFDILQLDNLIEGIARHEKGWRHYFNQNKIRPLVIVYEDFVKNYDRTILDVLDFLGIPRSKNFHIKKPNLKKQSDSESEQWSIQYQKRALSDCLRSYFRITITKTLAAMYRLSGIMKPKFRIYANLLNRAKRSNLFADIREKYLDAYSNRDFLD